MDIPKDIREHLARAKAHLQDDSIAKALDYTSLALRSINNIQHIPANNNLEQHINVTLKSITEHPHVKILLQYYKTKNTPEITYKRGKENILAAILQEFSKMLTMQIIPEKNGNRLGELLKKAKACFNKGEYGTGTAYLQRAALEHDQDPIILNKIAHTLAQANEYIIAAKIFHKAIHCAPKELDNYTQAINNYMEAKNYPQAEQIFKLALRQFGGHPITYGRMANLYLAWEKYPEAKEFATRALETDPNEENSLQVIQSLEQINIT